MKSDAHRLQLGRYRFARPVPLLYTQALAFPGLFAVLTPGNGPGGYTVLYIGEATDLQRDVTFHHPIIRSIVKKDLRGQKATLLVAFCYLSETDERQAMVRELSHLYEPGYNPPPIGSYKLVQFLNRLFQVNVPTPDKALGDGI